VTHRRPPSARPLDDPAPHRGILVAAVSLAALATAGCGPTRGTATPSEPKPSSGGDPPAEAAETRWTAPSYDEAFRTRWYDGEAELASYALTYPRYGELRPGATAVAVTVAEHLDLETRIKPERDPSAGVSAIKLNLAEDFQTGIYDYHLMTSAWVSVEPALEQRRGAPLKVAFSSQEWCGMSFQVGSFQPGSVDHAVHSYFEGEASYEERLDRPDDAYPEDALYLWARGLGGPRVGRGETAEVALLRSMAISRLLHVPSAWDRATLRRAAETQTVEVPAGSFEAVVATVEVRGADGLERTYGSGAAPELVRSRIWTFWVEAGGDRRVLRYARNDGLDAQLVATTRAPYWQLNARTDEARLGDLGLSPRPPRTP